MDQDLKMKAAIAGVVQYIEATEEEMPAQQRGQIFTGGTPWSMSGRQAIMQMRALLQRRVLRRR
jgi:hypothetical protein